MLDSASSAPARSIEETARSTSCSWITSWIGTLCTSTSNIERSIESGFRPWLIVRLPCGSRSTRSTFMPCSANATPRLSVVVVLATPPFWLAKAMTLPTVTPFEISSRGPGRGSRRASPIRPFLSSDSSRTLYWGKCRIFLPLFEALPLAVPVVQLFDARDHADASERDLVRARVVDDVGAGISGPVREHRQAFGAGSKRVGHAGRRRTCDHVPGPEGVLVVAEGDRGAAVENHEDLFLGRVDVRRSAQHPGLDPVVIDPGEL